MAFSRQCEGKVRVNGWWEIFEDRVEGHGARWLREESGVRERWLHVMQRCDLKFIAKLLCAASSRVKWFATRDHNSQCLSPPKLMWKWM